MEIKDIKNTLLILSAFKTKQGKIAKTLLDYITNLERELEARNNTIERLLKEKR